MNIGSDIAVRHDKRHFRPRVEQTERASRTQRHRLAQVIDGHTELATLAEIVLDHMAQVMDGEDEVIEAFQLGALDDVLQHGLAGHRHQGLGAVFRVRHQARSLAPRHDHHQVGTRGRSCDLIPEMQPDNMLVLVDDGNLLDYESILSVYGGNMLPVTVKILNDGHGNCNGVSGGPMVSEMATFQIAVTNINERPTSLQLVCTQDMVLQGPVNGCVSSTFELDVKELEVGHIIGIFQAVDPDDTDMYVETFTYKLVKSTWTTRYFHVYEGNKLRIKNIDFDGTKSPIITIDYYVVDSGGLRYPQPNQAQSYYNY